MLLWYAQQPELMAGPGIYTRTYSRRGAGQLTSAKEPRGGPLSHAELANEFRRHADKSNRVHTALVSVSDRIIDTVNRAFDKHYEDGEPAADIWIAFIRVPATIHTAPAQPHAAQSLAEECRDPEAGLYRHEFVFEWAIPESYLVHEVALQTLMDRGLTWENLTGGCLERLPTFELRYCMAKRLQSIHDPWEAGIYLGSFARNFGARAPLDWVAHQLFYDCVRTKILEEDVVRLGDTHQPKRSEFVDFNFFCALDDGIETALIDWWLADLDFCFENEEFQEYRGEMEDSIVWDQVEFWEVWREANDSSQRSRHISRCEMAYNKIIDRHREIRAAVEAQAVRIGL